MKIRTVSVRFVVKHIYLAQYYYIDYLMFRYFCLTGKEY